MTFNIHKVSGGGYGGEIDRATSKKFIRPQVDTLDNTSFVETTKKTQDLVSLSRTAKQQGNTSISKLTLIGKQGSVAFNSVGNGINRIRNEFNVPEGENVCEYAGAKFFAQQILQQIT